MKVTVATPADAEEMSFDACFACRSFSRGRRRNPANRTYTGLASTHQIDRGYTGHEHLDAFGLINMPACRSNGEGRPVYRSFSEGRNGRMYDPLLGRFLSPDKFVQAPGNTQNYNSYSYCLNNPLKYTDPSGYILIDYSEASPDDPGGALNSNLSFLESTSAYLNERLFNLQLKELDWARGNIYYAGDGRYVNGLGETVDFNAIVVNWIKNGDITYGLYFEENGFTYVDYENKQAQYFSYRKHVNRSGKDISTSGNDLLPGLRPPYPNLLTSSLNNDPISETKHYMDNDEAIKFFHGTPGEGIAVGIGLIDFIRTIIYTPKSPSLLAWIGLVYASYGVITNPQLQKIYDNYANNKNMNGVYFYEYHYPTSDPHYSLVEWEFHDAKDDKYLGSFLH